MSFLFNNFLRTTDGEKSEPDMCDRLKVLSQKELDEIDMKIMKYKKSNEITVLDKSLHELQELVNLKGQELREMQTKYDKTMKNFNTINRSKISYESNVTSLESKIASVENETAKFLGTIEDLKIKEQELNSKLINLQKRNSDVKEEIESHLNINKELEKELIAQEAIINAEVLQFKEKLNIKLNDSYKLYGTHITKIQDMINVNIPSIHGHSTAQSVYMVNIEKLACLFKEYSEAYQSFRCNMLTSADSIYSNSNGRVNIPLQKIIACVHNIVCRGNCEGCDFPKLEFNYKLEKKNQLGYPAKGRIYNVLEDYGLRPWLEKHYKVICLHHVYNTELYKLIENTESYTELFELFSKSTVFDVKDYNIIDFLRFIAFIGNNGMPTTLYNIHDFKLHRCVF